MLWRAGVQTVLPPGYLCCGYPQRGAGQYDRAEKTITDNRVLFHRVANTLNYLDIKTVVVSCGTCYDQLQGYKFDEIFPGSRIVDIHEFLLEKNITLPNGGAYLYHDPCHSPMKQRDPMLTVKALVGEQVIKSDRCCGESGTFGVSRPDIATQVRFRKEEELRKDEAALRVQAALGADDDITVLTSCPSCLQGLSRYQGDLRSGLLKSDYIVVEMARRLIGESVAGGLRGARQRRRHRARAGLNGRARAPRPQLLPSGCVSAKPCARSFLASSASSWRRSSTRALALAASAAAAAAAAARAELAALWIAPSRLASDRACCSDSTCWRACSASSCAFCFACSAVCSCKLCSASLVAVVQRGGQPGHATGACRGGQREQGGRKRQRGHGRAPGRRQGCALAESMDETLSGLCRGALRTNARRLSRVPLSVG